MSYVIAEPCVSVCDGACVAVCPVDAIHGPIDLLALEKLATEERTKAVRGKQLFIDPESCICCGMCEPVCPTDAIFDESELPDKWKDYTAKNASYFAEK